MKPQKSPGPDGIPVKAVRSAVWVAFIPVLETMNYKLTHDFIPQEWKHSRLVFVKKPGGVEDIA